MALPQVSQQVKWEEQPLMATMASNAVAAAAAAAATTCVGTM